MKLFNNIARGLADSTSNAIYSTVSWYKTLADKVANKLNPRINLGELGVSGTDISGQYINEEYLAELYDPENAAKIYDQMRKSDPVINLSLLRYEFCLQSIKWSIDSPSTTIKGKKPSPNIEEKIDFVKANLFENPNKPWKQMLYEFASMLQFGHCCMEKVWEQKNGKIYLKSLEFRHPRTITWKFSEGTNKLEAILQKNYYGNKNNIPPIPIEKILLFVNNKLGDNFRGVSLVRPAYRPWFMKKELLKRIMICFERYLVKTPIIKTDNTVTDDGRNKLKEFLMSITSHQKSGGILPPGAELADNKEDFNKLVTALKQLEYFDKEMFYAANVSSAAVGMSGSGAGSLALSEDKTSIEAQGLQAFVDSICDVVNYGLIPDIIDPNFEEDNENQAYPILSAKITEENYQEWIKNTVEIVKNGIIKPYAEMIEQIANRQGYPEPEGGFKAMLEALQAKEEEQQRFALELKNKVYNDGKSDKQSGKNSNNDGNSNLNNGSGNNNNNGNKPGNNDSNKDPGKTPKKKSEINDCGCNSVDDSNDDSNDSCDSSWRPLTSLEESSGGIQHFAEQSKFLDISQKEFENAVKPIIKKQADEFFSVAKKGISNLMILKPSFVSEYQKAVEPILFNVALNGVKAVQKEMNKNTDNKSGISETSINRMKEWAKNKAMITAVQQVEDLRAFIAKRLADGDSLLLKDKSNQKSLSETASKMAFSRFVDLFNIGG